MTEAYFNQLYERLLPVVKRSGNSWKRWLRNNPGYNYLEADDLTQEIWLEIWLMPDDLPDGFYLDRGFRHATAVCAGDRIWHGEDRGRLVAEIPTPGGDLERTGGRSEDSFIASVNMELTLKHRINHFDWTLFDKYFRWELGKHPLEKRGRSKRLFGWNHFEGWTDNEIAKGMNISRSTVYRSRQRVIKIIKEILAEDGIETY